MAYLARLHIYQLVLSHHLARQLYPRILSKPGILYGKPVIEGTRLSVEAILQNLASGYTRDDLLDAYPFLTPKDITAAIEYTSSSPAKSPRSILIMLSKKAYPYYPNRAASRTRFCTYSTIHSQNGRGATTGQQTTEIESSKAK